MAGKGSPAAGLCQSQPPANGEVTGPGSCAKLFNQKGFATHRTQRGARDSRLLCHVASHGMGDRICIT